MFIGHKRAALLYLLNGINRMSQVSANLPVHGVNPFPVNAQLLCGCFHKTWFPGFGT